MAAASGNPANHILLEIQLQCVAVLIAPQSRSHYLRAD